MISYDFYYKGHWIVLALGYYHEEGRAAVTIHHPAGRTYYAVFDGFMVEQVQEQVEQYIDSCMRRELRETIEQIETERHGS